ncbi:MAG TPA: 3D domain-containing protein, partial [Peptostreptococcaceae bacterium]|nr:3D domain-containing protein [Peptostreptococcaceae bacterium]
VKELLIEQDVKVNSKDLVSVGLDSKLEDDMTIKIIRVKESTITQTQGIPYEIKIEKDNELIKGKTVIEQEGKEGKRDLVYKLVYHDGKEVDKQLLKEYISMDPVDRIVKEGTKEKVVQVVSRGNVNRSSSRTNATSVSTQSEYSKEISVTATAYTGGGTTSTGTQARWGVIAVDPNVIPYGTRVYIPQLKQTFVAQDTGSAIKGNKIDIYMDSKSQAISWGVKTITLYILK